MFTLNEAFHWLPSANEYAKIIEQRHSLSFTFEVDV
jgi:hypothetical protein